VKYAIGFLSLVFGMCLASFFFGTEGRLPERIWFVLVGAGWLAFIQRYWRNA
jgi:hypothetical protein